MPKPQLRLNRNLTGEPPTILRREEQPSLNLEKENGEEAKTSNFYLPLSHSQNLSYFS
jgi:hypothetical protein